jgi:hypothetical protein
MYSCEVKGLVRGAEPAVLLWACGSVITAGLLISALS